MNDIQRWLYEREVNPEKCGPLCVYQPEGQEAHHSSWQPPWESKVHQYPLGCEGCGFVTIHEVRFEEDGKVTGFCRYCGEEDEA